jgi:transposase
MDAPARQASDVPEWRCCSTTQISRSVHGMNVTTVGLDLAKNLFQVHGVNSHGKAVLRRVLKRGEMMRFFTQLHPCLIGIEACGSAHFWARQLVRLGHTVKLMAPQFVKPYVKTNKNDARDAEAICEAVSRPNMRYVPINKIQTY